MTKPNLWYILQDKGQEFIKTYGHQIGAHVVGTILQVLQCCTGELGYNSFFCANCEQVRRIPFTCKKRLCPRCSHWANRRFALGFVQGMLHVTHRHITFTIPDTLWGMVHERPKMQKLLLQMSYMTVKQTMELYLGGDVMPGCLCVLHNFGRDLKKNCHVHMIVTEGCLRHGKWTRFTYFPFEKRGKIHTTINEIWRDNVLEMLRLSLPRTENNRKFIEGFRKTYPKGFYVHGPKKNRIKTNKTAYNRAKYITRYVKHPPISSSRIQSYDGQNVTFWYEQPSTGKRYYRTLPVLEFIYRVVMHLPGKGFHVVVRYGLYSARYVPKAEVQSVFSRDGDFVDPKELSWREAMVLQNGRDPLMCERCHTTMIHICTVYKRRDKFKVKYHLLIEDVMAIRYPDDEHWLLREKG